MPLYSELSSTAVTPGAERHNTQHLAMETMRHSASELNTLLLATHCFWLHTFQPANAHHYVPNLSHSLLNYIPNVTVRVCAQGYKKEGIIPTHIYNQQVSSRSTAFIVKQSLGWSRHAPHSIIYTSNIIYD
jgi:hypothetical protein